MDIIARKLTQEEIQQAIQQAQRIAASASPTVQSGQFVFFAAFDGTNNDRDDLPESGTTQPTNVGQLAYQAESAMLSDANLFAKYYRGPGTDGTLFGSEALPWQVTQQVINTAAQAYNDFAAAASQWLQTNPGGSVTTMVTGFSRGGAPAALFSQMLYEKGLVDPNTGSVLIAPGQVGVSGALLFDPVLTGISGNMNFAPNATNITVVRAMDEFRSLFPAAEYNDPRINYVDFYGNHGDVGGFYDQGLGALSLEGATGFFRNLGLSIGSVPASRAFDPSAPTVIHTEGVDEYGNRLWDEYGSRGSRLTSSVGRPSSVEVLSNGSIVEAFTLYDGRVVTRTTDIDGNVTHAISETGGGTIQNAIGQYGGTLIDALSLVRAIQTGQPLPVVASGLRLANDLSTLSGQQNLNLSGVAHAASGILSLYGLANALERGDGIAAISAGAQTVSFAASAYANFLGYSGNSTTSALQQAIAAGEFGNAGQAIGAVSEALPYLNLINAIAHGDEVGAAVSVVSMIPGMQWVGVAYAVFSLIDSLFGDEADIPDPWGSGQFIWNGHGITYQAAGETGGWNITLGVGLSPTVYDFHLSGMRILNSGRLPLTVLSQLEPYRPTLFLFGHVDQLATLAAAAPSQTLVLTGYRRLGSRNLMLTGVRVESAPEARTPAAIE
jgi:hypothetical protein